MKYILKLSILSIALSVLFYSCSDSAKKSINKYTNIIGDYKTTFSSSSGYFEGTTTIFLDNSEHLTGKYQFNMGNRNIEGKLSSFNEINKKTFECDWKGKVGGLGKLKITFDDNYKSFKGVWNKVNGKDKYVWDGVKK